MSDDRGPSEGGGKMTPKAQGPKERNMPPRKQEEIEAVTKHGPWLVKRTTFSDSPDIPHAEQYLLRTGLWSEPLIDGSGPPPEADRFLDYTEAEDGLANAANL